MNIKNLIKKHNLTAAGLQYRHDDTGFIAVHRGDKCQVELFPANQDPHFAFARALRRLDAEEVV